MNRPYTFVVLAILILIASPVVIMRTPTDIFPSIDIPVISIAWQYTGLSPEELEGRLTTPYEKALTTLVDNIEHTESTTLNGQAIIKLYLQEGASVDRANSQVSAASEYMLKQLPPGILPPQIINFSASSVPILQLGLSGHDLTEQQLNDYGSNFVRPGIATVPGIVLPNVYGGKQRSIMVNLDPKQMQAKHLSPVDILNAINDQNVVEPGGTAKIGSAEYDVRLNSTSPTVEGLGNLPIRQVGGTTIYLHDVAQVTDWRHPADQHRPPGRPPRRTHQHPEVRQRLHPGRRQGRAQPPAAHQIRPAFRLEDHPASPTRRTSSGAPSPASSERQSAPRALPA